MSEQGSIFDEATGTYVGELLEDMIDTVSRTHKMYCDVDIPQFFSKDKAHPLTYVPLWGMSLPLKKGDKVIVKFCQNDLTLPMLYKNPDEIDKGFYEKFDFGNFVQGGNVTKPTAENTLGSQKIGTDSYLIKTANYTVIHQNNGFLMIDKDGKVYVYGSAVNIVATGDVKIDAGGNAKVFSSGSVEIKGNSGVTINNHLKVTV